MIVLKDENKLILKAGDRQTGLINPSDTLIISTGETITTEVIEVMGNIDTVWGIFTPEKMISLTK